MKKSLITKIGGKMRSATNKVESNNEADYIQMVSEIHFAYEKIAEALIQNEMLDACEAVVIAYRAFEKEVFEKIKKENK